MAGSGRGKGCHRLAGAPEKRPPSTLMPCGRACPEPGAGAGPRRGMLRTASLRTRRACTRARRRRLIAACARDCGRAHQIKRAYHKLAMVHHPDKRASNPNGRFGGGGRGESAWLPRAYGTCCRSRCVSDAAVVSDAYHQMLPVSIRTQCQRVPTHTLAKPRTYPTLPPLNATPSDETFKEIGYAYKVLSDPEKRQLYDMGGMDAVDQQVPHTLSTPFDPLSDPYVRSIPYVHPANTPCMLCVHPIHTRYVRRRGWLM